MSYSVWVGGSEINARLLTYFEAKTIADLYISDGYDDVQIERQEV